MSEIVQNQYSSWQAENSGKWIYNGFIYVGQVDTDPLIEANRVRVYYIDENEQEVNLTQPIRTNSSGFPVISETNSTVIQIRTDGDYSVKVLNKGKVKEWYIPKASSLSPVIEINHNDTLNRSAIGAHDDIYIREINKSDVPADSPEIGTRYRIDGERYTTVSSSDTGGIYILDQGELTGLKLRLDEIKTTSLRSVGLEALTLTNTMIDESINISTQQHIPAYAKFQGKNYPVITNGAGNVLFSTSLSDGDNKTKFAEISGIEIVGQSERPTDGSIGIRYEGDANQPWNFHHQMRIRNLETGFQQSAGWNNVQMGLDIRACDTGVKYVGSPLSAGWAGSGQTWIANTIQYNNTGIDESGTPWHNTYINNILEGNNLGMNVVGNDALLIQPWFEANGTDWNIVRGITVIGGRLPQWTSADISFNSAADAEFINIITSKQLLHTRGEQDGSDAITYMTGRGWERLQGRETGASQTQGFNIVSSGWTQGGDTTSLATKLYGGYFPSRIGDVSDDSNESKLIDVRYIAKKSSSGTGRAVGSLEFELAQFENTGLAFNNRTIPLVLEPNLVGTGGDAVADLGQSTNRFNNSYFAVAPTVGSDARIKPVQESIPQELLDFALTVELKQYKLANSTSDRYHFGIVIDEQFIENLNSVYGVSNCAAICHDVFYKTIENDNGDSIEVPAIKTVYGVELGDLWQVRHDEWQNILLEAMRRKINS